MPPVVFGLALLGRWLLIGQIVGDCDGFEDHR